jgi:hypothetical protein
MLENSSLFLLLEKKKAFWPGENYYSIYKYTFEVDKLAHNLLMNKSARAARRQKGEYKKYSFFLSRRKAMETRWKLFANNSSSVLLFDTVKEKTA